MKDVIRVLGSMSLMVLLLTGTLWASVAVMMRRAADGDEARCFSKADSVRAGLFLADLAARPSRIEWKGRAIRVREAWMEARAVQRAWWFGCYPQATGVVVLCFTLEDGNEVFDRADRPFFVRPSKGQSVQVIWVRESRPLFRDEIAEGAAIHRLDLVGSWEEAREMAPDPVGFDFFVPEK